MPLVAFMTTKNCDHRTGFGFDSHAFGSDGTLVLGGVSFSGTPALKGHSDGDVLLHALIDALLGAAGLGDIGEMFPDSSAANKGISSLEMLSGVMKRLSDAGFQPLHVDVTVGADKPKLTPAKEIIREKISTVTGLSKDRISIKAKTQEGLSWFANSGGIVVWAVATVTPRVG